MTYLASALQAFFTDYVHTQRDLTDNTIASYRDTWRLLIKHICATTATSADRIRLEDLDVTPSQPSSTTSPTSAPTRPPPATPASARSGSSSPTPCPTTQNTPRPSAAS